MRFGWAAAGLMVLAACGDAGEGGSEAEENGDALSVAQFAANPAAYDGQEVTLDSVAVASRLGEQAFWMTFPNENAYLVKLDSALVAGGTRVASGEAYRVSGRVVTMSDSVLAAWEQSGAIADPGQRAEAQYAMSFIEANRLERRSR